MKELDKSKVYYLGDLTDEQKIEIVKATNRKMYNFAYLIYCIDTWSFCSLGSEFKIEPTNAKELFETSVEEKQIFYFNKSKHGENFYRKLETLNVKNEHHNWKTYIRYQQLGTNLIFAKPEEMFNKEFKAVYV